MFKIDSPLSDPSSSKLLPRMECNLESNNHETRAILQQWRESILSTESGTSPAQNNPSLPVNNDSFPCNRSINFAVTLGHKGLAYDLEKVCENFHEIVHILL